MGKMRTWLTVAGAFFLGLAIGEIDPDDVSPPRILSGDEGTTIARKADRFPGPSEPAQISVAPTKKPEPPKAIEQALVEQPPPRPDPQPIKPKVFHSKTMYVDATSLNVRESPTRDGKVIWTLKQNERVVVTAQDEEWLRVTGQRYQGWVFGSYLTPKPAPVQRPVPVVSGPSTKEIKQILIRRSHAYYSGNCPCPYNTMSNGRRCGGRSAYSRPGGASPLCYESDVSDAMVADYRARQ